MRQALSPAARGGHRLRRAALDPRCDRTALAPAGRHRRPDFGLRIYRALRHRPGPQACAGRARPVRPRPHPLCAAARRRGPRGLGPARDRRGSARTGLRGRVGAGRDHRRQRRSGERALAHPRGSGRGADPGRRVDQARCLGAGEPGRGLHRGGRQGGRAHHSGRPALSRSAMSATATSTTTSPSPSAPTSRPISRAGKS